MKICIALFENRISSVFENARCLRLYYYCRGEVRFAGEIKLDKNISPSSILSLISSWGADILLCGAIEKESKDFLIHRGIQVEDWLGGQLEDVISALKRGDLSSLCTPGRNMEQDITLDLTKNNME